MDPVRFDTLARTLATPGSRRHVLAALLSGSLGLMGLSQSSQGRKRRGGGDVTIEGPCGDGSGPDNRCKLPEDCCTGICERVRRGKPKRCRCRHKGQACTETPNCCQGAGLVCDGGTCQPAPCTACSATCPTGSCDTGQACLDNGTCARTCSLAPGNCGALPCDCRNGYGGGGTGEFICVNLGASCPGVANGCVESCDDCPTGCACSDDASGCVGGHACRPTC
jgi:hypothetical protein